MSSIVGRIVLDVIEVRDDDASCSQCHFEKFGKCYLVKCSPEERPDGKSVIFKAHPETPVPPRGRNDCPKCGAGMLLLATQNRKVCVDCCVTYPWELSDGQKPLVSAQR
jgi:ribosomal protein S27AE